MSPRPEAVAVAGDVWEELVKICLTLELIIRHNSKISATFYLLFPHYLLDPFSESPTNAPWFFRRRWQYVVIRFVFFAIDSALVPLYTSM